MATPDADAIRPFTIAIADDVLTDLQDRLARTRLPEQIPGTGWDQGTNLAYLEGRLAYCQDGFDWRAPQRRPNGFGHFKPDVDCTDVPFIPQRPANAPPVDPPMTSTGPAGRPAPGAGRPAPDGSLPASRGRSGCPLPGWAGAASSSPSRSPTTSSRRWPARSRGAPVRAGCTAAARWTSMYCARPPRRAPRHSGAAPRRSRSPAGPIESISCRRRSSGP